MSGQAVSGEQGSGRPSTPSLTALFLAAGFGRRYGGLKQLDPFGPSGATLVDYSLYDAWRSGFGRAVFVIRPEMATEFERTVRRRYQRRMEIVAAFQRLNDLPPAHGVPAGRTRPWGTAHAVLSARDQLTGGFVVLNADDKYGREALSAAAEFLRCANPASNRHAVLGFRLDHTLSPVGGVNRAVLEADADGVLRRVTEITGIAPSAHGLRGQTVAGERLLAADAIVSMNLWALGPPILPPLTRAFDRFLRTDPGAEAEYQLPEGIQDAVERGEASVQVLPTGSRWCGVTYAGDRDWVRAVLAEETRLGLYPDVLWDEA